MSGKIYNSSPATSNITPQQKTASNPIYTAALVNVAEAAKKGTPNTASSHLLNAIKLYTNP